MHDFNYVSPQEYLDVQVEGKASAEFTLEELTERANAPHTPCKVCNFNNAWKLAGIGMCFTCTTGETDASNDFELRDSDAPETS